MNIAARFRDVVPLLFLFAAGRTSVADELFPKGSFETPVVEARTAAAKGGDPSHGGKGPEWIAFTQPESAGDKLIAGLTNEVARTGKQALFIQCEKFGGRYQAVSLPAAPVGVMPMLTYRIGIWGRLDAKNPLVVGEHSLAIKMQIDFLGADKVTQIGEPVVVGQSLPGPRGRPPFFVADKWVEFWTQLIAPEGAAWVAVTWRCETGGGNGEINGTLFFDDASVQGPAASAPVADPGANAVPK